MNQGYPSDFLNGKKRHGAMTALLSAFVMLALLLSACDGSTGQPVINTESDAQEEVAAPEATVEVEQNDAMTETLEAADTTDVGTGDVVTGDMEIGDVSVITSTELITGTEITTDVTVTTDTVVLEQQLITSVITATDLVTDVTESSNSNTVSESEVVTNTAELQDQTASGEAEVEVTPIAPTPTPTVVVEVTRVVTDTEVVTDTVEVTRVATPRAGQTPEPQAESDDAVAFAGLENSAGRSLRATTLIDANFETSDGEVGGEIQDLVINMQTGQVVYVLLEYGGFLDLGDTDMPAPLSAFNWSSQDQLGLNIDGQRLENFPGVSNDWPVPDDDNWDLDVRNFWDDIGIDPGFDAAQAASGIRRASDLLDDPISDASFGEGSVEDMIISLGEGRVTYVLVSFAGAGLGEDWYVIAFNAFDPTGPRDGLYLNPDFDASLLERAPTYDNSAFDQSGVFEEGYDNDWNNFWNDAGYGWDIGNGN